MDKRKELKLKILGKYETVTNFAKAAGMSRQHISDIINGKAVGSIEIWEKINQCLGLTPAELWQYQLELRILKKNGK